MNLNKFAGFVERASHISAVYDETMTESQTKTTLQGRPGCRHRYTADYSHRAKGVGVCCPYPAFYEKLRSDALRASNSGTDLEMPLDESGLCIFHSRNIEWKRQSNFAKKFAQLLEFLEADEEMRYYDFAEFVLVGDEGVLRLQGHCFAKPVSFTGAIFVDPIECQGLDFTDVVHMDYTTFEAAMRVHDTTFRLLSLTHANFKHLAVFSKVNFITAGMFHDSHFSRRNDLALSFSGCRFKGLADFSSIEFDCGGTATVQFYAVDFEDMVDFIGTRFLCQVTFFKTSFGSDTEFIDASFSMVESTNRYAGGAVVFSRIEVKAGATLNFKSTDPRNKMFDHNVHMTFEHEPTGIIRFENVNFGNFSRSTRATLLRLQKSGSVVIGAGCIKYRHQTNNRTIPVSQGNAPLVLEICQTFANYFSASNGFNLGFEVVERTSEHISFFYFTDEDISEAEFLERLRRTERGLWNLLAARSTGQLMAFEGLGDVATTSNKENRILNAVDGISALLGTFFRVGARVALGRWKQVDTKALLNAIRFNEKGADQRTEHLHALLVNNYTGRNLLGINTEQNEYLAPYVESQPLLPSKKIRILFLDANSRQNPLALDREAREIQMNLKLAQERDNLVFKQERAVTVESLMQAMFDESPAIVHFSGHGRTQGIVLQDRQGRPKLVDGEALASLFKQFRDTVQCVVLCSCYSEHQARAIRRHVPHVIGMKSTVQESTVIAFSSGFYKAIGAGEDISSAFDYGKIAVQLDSGENLAVLL